MWWVIHVGPDHCNLPRSFHAGGFSAPISAYGVREDVHPKVVQEMLGHSRIGVTLGTYSHAVPSMQRDVADKLDHLFEAVALKDERQPHPPRM